MVRQRKALVPLLAAIAVLAAGCSHGVDRTHHPRHAPAAPRTHVATASSRPVTKVLVLVVENHSLAQMRAQMPYLSGLAERFGYASDYTGVAYPSLPNYIAITSGSIHGIHDDGSPQAHPLSGPSVFGEALASGRSAKVYADGMPSNCAPDNGGDQYAVKHNPWPYYVSERSQCEQYDVPASRLAEDVASAALPDIGMVIPNMCHDAHDCDLSVADHWIAATLTDVLAGPDWKSGHLAVVVTADTDDRSSGNKVLTVVIHPSQQGDVVGQPLNHYSLSRLLSQVVGARPLGDAAKATSMSDAFGLPVR
jgi:acid phosphatase